MEVVVLLFGTEAVAAGRDRLVVMLAEPNPTCALLRQRLSAAEPALSASLRTARFAVNHSFAPDSQPLEPGDEVALIGMVSGG